MKRFLILILLLSASFMSANAYEIVYPKEKVTTINSPSTFFIGHIGKKETLKINGQDVSANEEGNFAYVVKLVDGKNTFTFDNETQQEVYNIIKPSDKLALTNSTEKITLTNYETPKFGYVNTENSPLRSTPQDFGINRLSHLQKNTNLILTGEDKNFYKIKLTQDENGWIGKKFVTLIEEQPDKVDIFDYHKSYDNEFDIQEFFLTGRVPFKISETNPFSLTLYNIDNKTEKFTTNPTLEHKLVGYEGYYEGSKFVLKIRKYPVIGTYKPLKNIKIAIDAGHGGTEYGAIGCSGVKEKDINLQIAKRLKKALKKRGATVIMARDNDIDMDLNDRVKKANDNDAMILLSIHANALNDNQDPNKISGTSVYYYYNQAKPLAENILNSIVTEAETNNDKIHQESFALVRNTNALSVLIEVGYMINPEDNVKLETPKFQKKVAKGIADGIIQYFKE